MASVHYRRAPYTPEYVENLKKRRRVRHRCGGVRSRAGRQQPLLANYANAYKAKYRRDLTITGLARGDMRGRAVRRAGACPDLSREALTEALRATDLQAGGNPFVLRDGVKFDQAGDNVRAKGLVMQLLDGQQRISLPGRHRHDQAGMADAALVQART